MILQVVAIRDSAMDAYHRPFFLPTLGMATRTFSDETNRADANNALYNHPQDHALWVIALWNEATGEFIQTEPPRQLVRGQDVHKGDKT